MRAIVSIGLLIVLLPVSARAEENDIDTEEITARLADWAGRITNLRIVWEETYHDLDGQPKRSPDYLSNRSKREWLWSRDGRWREHAFSYMDDAFHENKSSAFDGEYLYKAAYHSHDSPPNTPHLLSIGFPVAKELLFQPINPLDGIWNPWHRKWLGELLIPEHIEFWGQESVGDRVLPFLIYRTQSPSPEYPHPITLILDPDAGYLPRILRTSYFFLFEDNRVEQFEEIEPGFWFPMSGTYRYKSYYAPERNVLRHWKVLDVKLNQPLQESDFQIRPVRGTLVEDKLSGNKFKYGPGMPPDTLPSGLNRARLEWLRAGGPRATPPVVPSAWDRWKPLILLLTLMAGVAFMAGRIFWHGRHHNEV